MHDDFPADPVTIGIAILAVLAATLGYLGNGMLMATIFFAIVAIPLLVVEWIGFAVYDRFGRQSS